MYWTGKGGPRFIRPIRWMVALLGDEVVPFEVAGVQSGNRHERAPALGRAGDPRSRSADYEQLLRENFVLVSAAERRARSRTKSARCSSTRLKVKPDPALLDTLVYLTEFPTADSGRLRRSSSWSCRKKCWSR